MDLTLGRQTIKIRKLKNVSLKSVPKDIFQKQFPDCIVLQECKNTLFLRRFEKIYKQFRENKHFFLILLNNVVLFCCSSNDNFGRGKGRNTIGKINKPTLNLGLILPQSVFKEKQYKYIIYFIIYPSILEPIKLWNRKRLVDSSYDFNLSIEHEIQQLCSAQTPISLRGL